MLVRMNFFCRVLAGVGLLLISAESFLPVRIVRYESLSSSGRVSSLQSKFFDASGNEVPRSPNPLTDLADGVVGTFQSNVNQLTGKSAYEFGDLSRYVEQQAKDGLATLNKKTQEGILGLDQAVKAKVCLFTGKGSYQVGDISREVIRRFLEGEYTMEDIWLFLKIVAIIGLNIKPIAAMLPVRVLTDLLEVSTAQALGDKVAGVLTNEIELRLQQWMILGEKEKLVSVVSSNVNMKGLTEMGQSAVAGQLAKKALSDFTGKEDSHFGDVIRKIWGGMDNEASADSGESAEDESNTPAAVQMGTPTQPSSTETPMPAAQTLSAGDASTTVISEDRQMTSPTKEKVVADNPASLSKMDSTSLASFQEWDAQNLNARRTSASPEATSWTSLMDRDFEEWDRKFLEASFDTT